MPPKKKDLDFGKGFEELEQIADWYEKGEPDLEQGLQKFDRAMELVKLLKERLTDAENRMKQIHVTPSQD